MTIIAHKKLAIEFHETVYSVIHFFKMNDSMVSLASIPDRLNKAAWYTLYAHARNN